MKNKLKKTIIFLIIILITFVIVISYYKFIKKSKIKADLMILDISNNPKLSNIANKFDDVDEVYSKKFPYNIKFFNVNDDFSGILNLVNGELTLYDNYTKKTKKIIDDNIEKIALGNSDLLNALEIYALSENNSFYFIKLEKGDLEDITIKKFDLKVNYMTNLKSYMLDDELKFNIVVYGKDNKYYLMPYEIPYEKDMIIVKDKYAIYKNNVTTTDGRILKDKNGKDIIAKYIINVDSESNIFLGVPDEVIITNNNIVTYMINDKLFINDKKIKEFKLVNEDELSTFEIIYEDETKEIFKGYYDKDFNKFDNN